MRSRRWWLPVLAVLLGSSYALCVSWQHGYWDLPTKRVPRAEIVLRDGVLRVKGSERPFVGVMIEQANGGRLLSEIPVWRGKVHGIARGWHPNGHLEVEERFVSGVSQGVRTRWHENGTQRSTATIVNGVLEGPYTEWHDNGQKALEMTLVHGLGEGQSLAWHRDGKLKSKVTLQAGKPIATEYLSDNTAKDTPP